MSILWVILIVGFFTFVIRLSFILLFGRYDIPPTIQRALRYVPPAALSAIILPDLLASEGSLNLSLTNFRLLAGLVAIIVAWRSKNIFLTILIGMAVLILLQTFF